MHAYIIRTLTLITLVALTGCADSSHDDLKEFIRETKARPSGEIEPIPTFRPYKAYKYTSVAMRSPFEPPQVSSTPENDYGEQVEPPDESRPKDILENFSFSQLNMVGTLKRDGKMWALVDDGQGRIHRVTLGDYMGKNHGRIVSISETQVDIVEIVPDGKGGWVERPRTLGLEENEA